MASALWSSPFLTSKQADDHRHSQSHLEFELLSVAEAACWETMAHAVRQAQACAGDTISTAQQSHLNDTPGKAFTCRSDVLETAAAKGLDVAAVDHLLRYALELSPGPVISGHYAPLGMSRRGGRPDVGPDFVWPLQEGVPMQFVAQVNFADMTAAIALGGEVSPLLPVEGLLLLFVNPDDLCGFTVYCPAGTPLHRAADAPCNLGAGYRFAASGFRQCAYTHARELRATPGWSLPTDVSEAIDWGPAWPCAAAVASSEVLDCSRMSSNILGYGFYSGGCNAPDTVPRYDGYTRLSRPTPLPPSPWRLLLQLVEEGSGGHWYVWARTEDLLARRSAALHHLSVSFSNS